MFRHFSSFLKTVFFWSLAFWVAGYFYFLLSIMEYRDPGIADSPSTEAIVVLTGGSERLSTATEILVAGRAQKLLVSGVNPGISVSQIFAKQEISDDLLECCVELDRTSENTLMNAEETIKWMKQNEYRSMRLVTSNYHMPRAMHLFGKLAPKLEILPHPVASDSVKLNDWWNNFGTLTLLFKEYNKYLYALITV